MPLFQKKKKKCFSYGAVLLRTLLKKKLLEEKALHLDGKISARTGKEIV